MSKPTKKDYRAAYVQLRLAVLDLKAARLAEVNVRSVARPGMQEWSEFKWKLNERYPRLTPALERLLRVANEIDRTIDEEEN